MAEREPRWTIRTRAYHGADAREVAAELRIVLRARGEAAGARHVQVRDGEVIVTRELLERYAHDPLSASIAELGRLYDLMRGAGPASASRLERMSQLDVRVQWKPRA